MKKVIFSSVIVVALIIMMLPAVSPPPVSAAKGASVDFTQYANEDDEWIGSILQAGNSKYYECMSVPQRAILANIPSTTGDEHTFTFSHEATKGGKHAYDWVTAYNQGNEPPLAFDACGEKLGNTPDFATICENLHSDGDSINVDVPDDPFISKDGSTQDRIDAYEAEFGNRQIKIYGDQPISAANMTLLHSVDDEEDDGDSDIEYILTWTSNSTQIIIEMAGHLAKSGNPATNPIAWGFGLGAGYVSGGPYHFRLGELDGSSLGSQDNPIKGADVLPRLLSTIVAHKFNDLDGNGSQDSGEDDLAGWTMTLYEGSNCTGDFVASGITGINGDVVFDDLVASTYSVKETLEDGWTNSTELCQQVTIGHCETWILDFGNFEFKPDIKVRKTASPDSGAESTNVTFTITVENNGDLRLDPVKVVDTIPAGMSYVSTGTSPLPDSSTENPDGTWTVTWNNITSLDPGDIAPPIYLIAHIDGDAVGTLTNSVTATGTPPYGDDVEDTDTADVRVYHPGIDVEKTAYPGCGAASANITFTITVINTNGSILNPVIVVDTLPDGMSYVSDDTGGTESPEGTITWDIGSLASGNSATINLVASIDGDELGTLINEVTATGTPPEGGDVEASDTADVLAIDARISISPQEDMNIVGDEHVLTAKVDVDDGIGWEPYGGAIVTFEVTDGPGDLAPEIAITNSSGQAVTTLTSTEAGTSNITASTSICGYDISTDGEAYNSDPAEKKWIFARIKIDPPEDTNVVGDSHDLTATVETSTDGIDWDPYQGATVTFEVTSGPGDLNPVTDDTDADGEAKTTLTSTVVGTSIVKASTSIYDHDISTDSEAYNSDPAEKEWVYARIKIDPPEDTNVVGDSHDLTATVETSTDGIDWDPYEGATVTFEVTDGPGDLNPVTDVTDADGEAKTTLTSTVVGSSIVKASTSIYDHDISTDGEAYNSDPAEKEWVYARIKIDPPEDINVVSDSHNFTATVETSTNGTDWDPYEGATVIFEVTSGPGDLNPVTDVTDADGEAKTTLISTETGTTTVKASTTVYNRDLSTDGEAPNSDPGEKKWVDARISIFESGVNRVGQSHDFTITVEKYLSESMGWVPAAGVNVTPTHSGVGFITSTGPYVTDGSGQVTVTVNSYVVGTATVHASATVSICDIDIDVATDGYGAYEVDNTKRWTDGNGGGYSCSCCYECELTVDWEGCITSRPLYCSNDKLAVDCLGPSFDLSHNLFLEQGTHAPVVYTTTHYLIVVRELKEIPALPENMEAIVVYNITPANAEFNKDIFLTLGVGELPANALNVTMAYYDDINGVWELMESETGGPSGVAELTLSAPINHFSIYGVLAELEPTPPTQQARFTASGLNIEPTMEKLSMFVTKTGESATITANVVNDGGQGGTYTVELKLNGEAVDTEIVTLAAGQSKQVSFTVSELEYGQYEVEVAGLSSEFSTSRTITWWLIIVIIAAVGLIIWGVVWGTRRKRKTQLEG